MYSFVVEVAGYCRVMSFSSRKAAEEVFRAIAALEDHEIFTRGFIHMS